MNDVFDQVFHQLWIQLYFQYQVLLHLLHHHHRYLLHLLLLMINVVDFVLLFVEVDVILMKHLL